MKKTVILCCLLLIMIFSVGCTLSQLGETNAEGARRHQRVLTINNQEMNEDIDNVLLLHKPSDLSDKRVP